MPDRNGLLGECVLVLAHRTVATIYLKLRQPNGVGVWTRRLYTLVKVSVVLVAYYYAHR